MKLTKNLVIFESTVWLRYQKKNVKVRIYETPFPLVCIHSQFDGPLLPLHGLEQKNRAIKPGVVACTCHPATSVAKFRNGVGSIPVKGNSPSIYGWIL